MTDRLRVSIFGVGRMGRVHLEHLVRLHLDGRVELTALGDRMPRTIDSARAFVAELGPDADRLVQVAFQRHYDVAARAAAAWVADGLIGSIQQSDHVLQDKNPTPVGYDSSGITADMAIHLVYEAMSFRVCALPRWVRALQFMAPPYDDRAGEGANIVHV